MPVAAKRPCRHPGCKALATSGAYCDEHRRVARQRYDSQRGSSTERGYNSRWQKARQTFLKRSPLCIKCLEAGRVVEATVVDHIIPHEGDSTLFWDSDNWQPLCKRCHDSTKQAEERAKGRGVKKSTPNPR